MSPRFAAEAEGDFGDYLENLARDGRVDVAMRESQRVLGELVRLSELNVEGRSVRIESISSEVRRWFVRPFVVYYVRIADDFVVLRLFHARREPIER